MTSKNLHLNGLKILYKSTNQGIYLKTNVSFFIAAIIITFQFHINFSYHLHYLFPTSYLRTLLPIIFTHQIRVLKFQFVVLLMMTAIAVAVAVAVD
ncbi:hypothetical protein QVD17_27830 [Tagetes erecta]|uniref:Uncharacterized protein n=1 Tax=Tagetes erecta TaxID=13708 RepID=A0AAD8NRG3_TARER|nr:hypothetical protein QVD17_27830 [Tagetes erecta]